MIDLPFFILQIQNRTDCCGERNNRELVTNSFQPPLSSAIVSHLFWYFRLHYRLFRYNYWVLEYFYTQMHFWNIVKCLPKLGQSVPFLFRLTKYGGVSSISVVYCLYSKLVSGWFVIHIFPFLYTQSQGWNFLISILKFPTIFKICISCISLINL